MKTPKTFSQSALKSINGTTEPSPIKVKTDLCVGRDYFQEPGKIDFPNLK